MQMSSFRYLHAVSYTCTCLSDIAWYPVSEKKAIPYVIFIRSSEIKLWLCKLCNYYGYEFYKLYFLNTLHDIFLLMFKK